MVLPTKELSSTLTPFTVLTPEDSHGVGQRGRERAGQFDGNKFKSSTISTVAHKKAANRKYEKHQNQKHNQTLSRLQSLSPPPVIPVHAVEVKKPSRQKRSASEAQVNAVHHRESESERRIQSQVPLTVANELDAGRNNSRNNYPESLHENPNKILNLLNARNKNFLGNPATNEGHQTGLISEDELLSDLKSRFLEKHFRTILRSQQSKESRVFGGPSDSSFCNTDTLPADKFRLNVNDNASYTCKNGQTKDDQTDFKNSTLLKSLKFVTVERPEPTLDLPQISYFKSTQLKLLKMHEQAKARVADRYRKVCGNIQTKLLPQLYPLQVLAEVIFSNIFVTCVAPFVLCGVLLVCLVRVFVSAILKLRYKGRFKLMDGADAAWAHQSFANDCSFMSLYVVQGDCSISRIRERIMKSLINCQDPRFPGKYIYSRLRSRITEKFGFYCWEQLHPLDFCIDEHVKYITNDPSAVLTQEQVLREIQKFIDQPLPEDQPQWQILVVPKFLYNRDYYPVNDDLDDDGFGNFDTITVKKKPNKNNNSFYTGNHYYALVWRINHAVMDGISAANALQHCIADMPVELSIDPLKGIPVPIGMRISSYFRLMMFGSRSLLRSMLKRDLNCFHGPRLTGPKNLAWSRGINLQAVKAIRKKYEGTTTTAVWASSVGTALKGLALRKNNPVPKVLRAGVTCALLPYPNIHPQNRFTVAHLKLKMNLETHKERLASATKSAMELVRNGEIMKNYVLIKTVGLVPKKAIPWFMDNCEATVLISNIPGPKQEYTIFQGQKLVDIIGWNTIKGNTAIGICMFSYAGRIRAGVIADGAVLPSSTDVPGLIDELEKDILSMAKEADLKDKDVFIDAL